MDAPRNRAIFHTLDGMRGVAALAVVMLHVRAFFGFHPRHAYLAVDLFFVMSGFVLAHAYEDKLASGAISARQFMVYRLIRLWPLFALSSVVAAIGVYLGDKYMVAGGWSASALVVSLGLSFFMVPSPLSLSGALYPLNIAGWSLFFEILANAAYCCVLFPLSRRVLLLLIAGCGVVLVASIAMSSSHQVNVGLSIKTSGVGLARVGFSFLAGVVTYRVFLARRNDRLAAVNGNLLAAACLGVVAAALFTNAFQSVNAAFTVAFLLLGPVVVYVAAHAEPSHVLRRGCRLFGDTSYAVYLLHLPLGYPFAVLLLHSSVVHGWLAPPTSGFVLIGFLLAVTYAIDISFDRPARKFLVAFCKKRGILRRPDPRPIQSEQFS